MRLTTKIISGITLIVFIAPLIFMIIPLFSDSAKAERTKFANKINLPQDNKTGIELTSFKTIVIEDVSSDTQGRNYSLQENCNIYFEPLSGNNNPDMLFLPEAIKNFVSVNNSGDTLTIKLNIHELYEKNDDKRYCYHDFSGVNLYFNTQKIDVINTIGALTLIIRNIETDSIKVTSHGNINIDSCKVLYIDPQIKSQNRNLNITNCEADKVNIDYDNISNWSTNNSKINEINISASRECDIYMNDPNIIKWIPKSDDAKLNIGLKGENKKITIQ